MNIIHKRVKYVLYSGAVCYSPPVASDFDFIAYAEQLKAATKRKLFKPEAWLMYDTFACRLSDIEYVTLEEQRIGY